MYKYAVVLLNVGWPFPEFREPIKIFDDHTYLFSGRYKDFEFAEDISFWGKWLGSTKWEEIEGFNGLILFTYMETQTPEVLDKENNQLTEKLYDAYMTMKVIDYIHAPYHAPFSFSGHTDKIVIPKLRFKDVRQTSSLKVWSRPYFFTADPFMNWEVEHLVTRYGDFISRWEKFYHQFRTWKSNYSQYKIWFQSYLSYQEAFRSNHLEFKMPNLVRSTESVLALPKGKGAISFARRAMNYLTIDTNHPLIDFTDLNSDLQKLYDMRNDCSHGKPFGWSLDKNLKVEEKNINLDVARFEYLAETYARAIIQKALFDEDLIPLLHDRDAVEAHMKKYD